MGKQQQVIDVPAVLDRVSRIWRLDSTRKQKQQATKDRNDACMKAVADVAEKKIDQDSADQWLRDIGEPRWQAAGRELQRYEADLFNTQVAPVWNGARQELAQDATAHLDAFMATMSQVEALERGLPSDCPRRAYPPCVIPDLDMMISDFKARIASALQPRTQPARPRPQRPAQPYEPTMERTHALI